MKETGSQGRIPGLDGLRAVAVGLVIASHFCPTSDSSLKSLRLLGSYGVQVFFVLSGFLITHLLLLEERRLGRIDLRLFILRRGVRILPPMAVYLAFLAALSASGFLEVPSPDLAASLFFVRNYFGTSGETAHLWSLAIEEQFYLAWPLFLIGLRDPVARVWATAFLLLVGLAWSDIAFRIQGDGINIWRTDLRFTPLLSGALLALLSRLPSVERSDVWRGAGASWCLPVAALCIVTSFCSAAFNVPLLRGLFLPLGNLAIVWFVRLVIVLPESPVFRFLLWRPVVGLGRLSYSLYLWQQLFAPSIPGAGPTWYRQPPVHLALAFLFAVAAHFAVERPLLGLRHRFRS